MVNNYKISRKKYDYKLIISFTGQFKKMNENKICVYPNIISCILNLECIKSYDMSFAVYLKLYLLNNSPESVCS